MRAYERLLDYVRVYTTSDPESGTHPSAAREFDLAHKLVEELKALGVPSAEPCQGVQIPKLRQLEQRILESINFTGNFQNRRILLALMPGGPPFPSIIIRTGIGYLAGRTGALLKQIFKGAGSSQ